MKTISYKGALYVEAAAPHKKCPTGTHWNILSKKCEKLPAGLAKASRRANIHSKNAGRVAARLGGHKLSIDPTKHALNHHAPARKAHENASSAHWHASKKAHDLGFTDLSTKHSSRANYHSRQAVKHGA